MIKIVSVFLLTTCAFCADFHQTASSSSGASSSSSSSSTSETNTSSSKLSLESNSTSGSKSKEIKSSKAHYISTNNSDITEFSVLGESNFIGTLRLENAKERCEFIDKPLDRQGSVFVFKDFKTECKFSIKVKSGTVSAKSNGQACIEAGYCSKKIN
jgi:hypothetical protein